MGWTAWHLRPSAQCVQHGRGRRRARFQGRGTVGLSSPWRRGRFRGLPFPPPYAHGTTPRSGGIHGSAPLLSVDLQDVCKRAAEKLNIPWPTVVAETTKSRYESKRLPRAKRAARQLLPVFPELLEELAVTWKDKPFTSKLPVQGESALDVEAMEKAGLLRMPPMEPLVAAHLQPKHTAAANLTLPSKADRFQSSMTERAYKAIALSVRALNTTSRLTVYQVELQDEASTMPGQTHWEEICVVTDFSLHLHRCAVQAAGKAMATMVIQERGRWLNLANLSDREKEAILDAPVVAEGILQCKRDARRRRGTMRLCSSVCLGRHILHPIRHLGRPSHKLRPAHPPAIAFLDGRDRTWMQRVTAESRNRELPGLGITIRLHQLRQPSQLLNLILTPILRERGGRRRQFDWVFPSDVQRSTRDEFRSSRTFYGEIEPVWARENRAVKRTRDGAVVYTHPLVTSTFHVQDSIKFSLYFQNMLQNIIPPKMLQNTLTNRSITSPRRVIAPLEVMRHLNSVRARNAHACAVQTTNSFASQPHDGARTLRINSWRECAQSRWVLRTIQFGYRLQFAASPPHFKGIINSHVRRKLKHVLQEEISSLLNKRAIRVVPPEQSHNRFYSRYFLVPKKGTHALRPILDLRALNKYLRKYKFRMLTHSTLLKLVRHGDWFTSIDLKDAYFHIKIYPHHRKFLQFAFLGVAYEYLVLLFGLSLSPRVFVKCTEAALTPLREKGIRLATYTDDWLVTARSEQEARVTSEAVLALRQWRHPSFLVQGVPMGVVRAR